MNVLSLFDGMSGGQIALNKLGVKVDKYYASEIDKHAIKVAKENFPSTIHVGDVALWHTWDIDWSSVDLILAGSPCQGFSFAGKQLAFDDPRSALFFKFVEILEHVRQYNPDVKFLLENVRMKQEFVDVINEFTGVEPIMINSNLVSAQNRVRLYWTNILGVSMPEDREVLLWQVLHEFHGDRDIIELESYMIDQENLFQMIRKDEEKGKIKQYRMSNEKGHAFFNIHDIIVEIPRPGNRDLNFNGNYLFGCITPDRVNKRQNGQRFNTGHKFYTLTAQDRHGVLINGYVRKVTPTECERLQTVPEGYTAVNGVSDSQRYKMLGNGWTVDVIVHLLRGLCK